MTLYDRLYMIIMVSLSASFGEEMEGFKVCKANETIETVVQKNSSLSLLAHGDGVEISIYELHAGVITFLDTFRVEICLSFTMF